MNANTESLLRAHCPEVLLALHAGEMLLSKSRDLSRLEARQDKTAPSLQEEKKLQRSKDDVRLAEDALGVVLRRIGPLPDLDARCRLDPPAAKPSRSKSASKSSPVSEDVRAAALFLGATEQE